MVTLRGVSPPPPKEKLSVEVELWQRQLVELRNADSHIQQKHAYLYYA